MSSSGGMLPPVDEEGRAVYWDEESILEAGLAKTPADMEGLGDM